MLLLVPVLVLLLLHAAADRLGRMLLVTVSLSKERGLRAFWILGLTRLEID